MPRRLGRVTVTAAATRVSLTRRQIGGTLFTYGEIGMTSAGPLIIDDPEAIQIPANLADVTLNADHDPDHVRGHLAVVDDNGSRLYVVCQVADGELGDAALADADPAVRTRGGLSYELEDVQVVDSGRIHDGQPVPAVTSGRLVAIGQVPEPAYNSARIDQVAAARSAGASRTNKGDSMTPEQIARLAELRALESRTPEEETELQQLLGLAADQVANAELDDEPADDNDQEPAALAPTAARRPAVPRGISRPGRQATTTQPRALAAMCEAVTAAFMPGGGGMAAVTAALTDVTNSGAGANIDYPAWSGELWSGLQYEPEWTPLFNSADLTNWEGKGWRWTTKPAMADYAGDKADIPSNVLATEPSGYEAARLAVGHDFDRKFFDFPASAGGAAFLESYFAACRESWAVQLDGKVKAYTLANAVAYGAATTSLLKAAALALFGVKANTRARGTFVAVNDQDYLDLLDINENAVPAFLTQFNVDPSKFLYDASVPAGTVVSGVKQAATVRTLPGSPIRVEAQNLSKAGVDEAVFGYWAIEEHHTTGIVKTTFA